MLRSQNDNDSKKPLEGLPSTERTAPTWEKKHHLRFSALVGEYLSSQEGMIKVTVSLSTKQFSGGMLPKHLEYKIDIDTPRGARCKRFKENSPNASRRLDGLGKHWNPTEKHMISV